MSMVSALTEKNIETEEAEVKYLAKSDVQLNEKNGLTCLNLLEKLEEHDDVQNVYSNFDIPDIVMQKISENN
jgi:transcriptional/translational regulatory protein YebC/TACO1